MMIASISLWLIVTLPAWRIWLGGEKWYKGRTPGSRATKYTVLALILSPLYVVWGWWAVLVFVAVLLYFIIEHNSFGDERHARIRYWPVGYIVNWMRRNEDRLPHLSWRAGWTEWGEIVIGVWVGLVLSAALTAI